MLESIKQRLGRDDEQGFTLIELMVVVLIIAILLAIAIPTFLGARDSANARAAQSDLRNAATAQQTFWTNNQAWGTSGDMQSLENSLKWSDAGTNGTVSPGNNVMIFADTTNNGVILTAAGNDKNCYSEEIVDQPASSGVAAGTYYYVAPMASGATTCSAPSAGASGTVTNASASKATTPTWSLGW